MKIEFRKVTLNTSFYYEGVKYIKVSLIKAISESGDEFEFDPKTIVEVLVN